MNTKESSRFQVATIVLFCFCINVLGSDKFKNRTFENISVNNGLSNNAIFCIFQDSKGFIWFGTEDGLNRYDGYTIKHYRSNPTDLNSLSNHKVLAIIEDSANYLWIGTDNGLNRFDPATNTFKHYFHDSKHSHSLCNNHITSLSLSSDNKIWIGTKKGLDLLDPITQQFQHYKLPARDTLGTRHNWVTAIHGAGRNTRKETWIGTKEGLYSLNRETGKFTCFYSFAGEPGSLSDDHITCIFEDSDSTLWFGTAIGGINRYTSQTKSFDAIKAGKRGLSLNTITSIEEDDDGNLWIGTQGRGLNIIYKKNPKCIQHYLHLPEEPGSISWDVILSIYKSRSGCMLLGTYGMGVDTWKPSKKMFHYKSDPTPEAALKVESVKSVYLDKDNQLWVAGYGEFTLDIISREDRQYSHFRKDALADGFVRVIAGDKSERDLVWLGTDNSDWQLIKFDRINRKIIKTYDFRTLLGAHSNWTVFSIVEDRDDNMWVGTNRGLVKVDVETDEFAFVSYDGSSPEELEYNQINTLMFDMSGYLWIGTNGGGLFRYNPKDRDVRQFRNTGNSGSLSSNTIYSISEDENGNIWVGTSYGLNKFNAGKNGFEWYFIGKRLPVLKVVGIMSDEKGNLWLGTNSGIYRFEYLTGGYKKCDVNDGLLSKEITVGSCHKSRKGELFFGSTKGLNYFHPEGVKEGNYQPNVVLVDFLVFNESVPVGKWEGGIELLKKNITYTDEVKISYKESVIAFEFSALNSVSPEKIQYAYIMEGYDKDWAYVGNRRFTTYTKISPGTYVFRVKSTNSDGKWSEKEASLRLIVTPPFWKTIWFYGLCIFLLLSLVSTYIKVREKNLQLHNEQLEKQVKSRTKFITEQNKKMKKHNEIILLQADELKIKNEELNSLNATKDKFFSIIAHDLRNPVHLITGYSELLVDSYYMLDEDKKYEFISHLKNASGNLSYLLDNLLQWAYAQQGRLTYIPGEVMVNEVIVHNIEFMREGADKKRIALEDVSENAALVVVADINLLNTVLRNLISNAIKFTLEQGTVKVGYKHKNDEVVLFVKDNGVGIKPENVERLFEVDSGYTTKGTNQEKGTGLGLLLCKEFVEKMGGKIWVKSEFGIGTTIYFTLKKK